jgi:MFS family permease
MNRSIAILIAGQSVSGLGNWVSFVGLNLYVYEVFGSGKVLGTFLLLRLLPAVFFGPLGGALADRFRKRDILILCDCARALLILGFLFTRELWLFYALGLALSALDKVFGAANGAYIPHLVEKGRLMEANTACRMSQSLATILGPALGGLLVAACSYKWVFLIDSVTFAFSVACLLLIPERGEPEPAQAGQSIAEFKLVWAFFAARAGLAFLTAVRLIDALGSGVLNATLPVFSRGLPLTRGAAYGWLVAAWAAGELLGAWSTRRLAGRLPLGTETLFSAAVAFMALAMGAVYHAAGLPFAMGAILLSGIGDGVSNVLYSTLLMERSPSAIRGRIFGSNIALIHSALAAGMAAGGFLLDSLPLRRITDLAALAIVLGVLAGYVLYSLKRRPEGP